MRTKLALLLALSRSPALLILDEPTEGLDPVSIEELLQTLVTGASTRDDSLLFIPSVVGGGTHRGWSGLRTD
jgi:ABC-type multidrug transport system ATPase subunit